MAFTLAQSYYDEILSAFPDADPSKVSAKVIAYGDETASASIKLSVSADDGAITSSAETVAEADGTKITTTGEAEASGGTASTLLNLRTSVKEQDGEIVARGSSTAEAEAAAEEGGTANASVSTDAEATGFDSVEIVQSPPDGVATDQGWEVTQTGDNPTATSSTAFEAVRVEEIEADALELTLVDEGVDWFVLDGF